MAKPNDEPALPAAPRPTRAATERDVAAAVLYKLSLAKHDPAHCLAPNLFRTYGPADYVPMQIEGKPLYEVTKDGTIRMRNGKPIVRSYRRGYISEYIYGDYILRFAVAEGLGPEDLRVLQGLIALAGANVLTLGPKPKTAHGAQLRLDLMITEAPLHRTGAVVCDSFYRLAKEIGYANPDSGSATRQIRESIERLFNVSIIATHSVTKVREGFRLLASYHADGHSMTVALNPHLANAVIAGNRHGYTRIELAEVRAIKLDVTRLLHQRLCAWISPGGQGSIGLDTLCSHVWPDPVDPLTATYRTRVSTVRKTLKELASLGWSITPFKKTVVIIRPATPLSPQVV